MIVPFIAVTRYFLQNKCRRNCLPNKNILKNHNLEKLSRDGFNSFFEVVKKDFRKNFPGRRKDSLLFLLWMSHLPRISRAVRTHSMAVAKNCMEHVEFVIAQRIRRGQQMFTLYSRLWDEKAFKSLLQAMRRMLQKRTKQFLIGGSLVTFNWEKERIPLDDLKRHANEMEFCRALRSKATHRNGNKNSQTSPEPDCSCSECSCTQCSTDPKAHKWDPFIIEDDLTVWKMKDPNNYNTTGLYCYKLYGKYPDVTAKDFLQVFLDTENRTKWDTHAATLKVIDTEPSTQSDVIYWETRWPMLFSNRDYVFKRRFYVDRTNNIIVVMNRSTEHPMYPPTSSKARVTEYWSYMVIKAAKSLEEPGMEFSLTYFDNPGIALPSTISMWVTMQGMPEYLKRLKIEALKIREKRKFEPQVVKPEDEERTKEGGKDDDRPPTPPPLICPPRDHDPRWSTADYIFLISSYFQKVKASLWM